MPTPCKRYKPVKQKQVHLAGSPAMWGILQWKSKQSVVLIQLSLQRIIILQDPLVPKSMITESQIPSIFSGGLILFPGRPRTFDASGLAPYPYLSTRWAAGTGMYRLVQALPTGFVSSCLHVPIQIIQPVWFQKVSSTSIKLHRQSLSLSRFLLASFAASCSASTGKASSTHKDGELLTSRAKSPRRTIC